MKRREFLSTAAGAGLAATLPRRVFGTRSPNDTINVAIVGLRGDNKGQPTWTGLGRGSDHYASLSGLTNVRISHVVDVDERHFSTSLPRLKERWGADPKTETDVRRVLDNKDVDAITVAVPDHWHALMTIWACQAGKDVYVEKPVCHNIWEGRKMIEAARKHKRVVQAGTQRRSSESVRQAVEFLRGGALGKIYSAKCSVPRPRDPIGRKPDSTPPPGVHYDLWLGPAPARPFNELRFHYTWHWFWDYGDADLGNNGVHVLDVLRLAIGKREHPRTIHCIGGLFEGGQPTDQETPNTQYVTFQYADGTILRCDVHGWFGGGSDGGSVVHGSKGWMEFGRTVKVFLGRKNEPGPEFGAERRRETGHDPHFQNWIDCMRSRKWENLNADVEEGVMSTGLCHLGNISYRVGREVRFDSRSERFVGDEEANKLLSREYRRPFVVPDKV